MQIVDTRLPLMPKLEYISILQYQIWGYQGCLIHFGKQVANYFLGESGSLCAPPLHVHGYKWGKKEILLSLDN